MEDRKCMTGRVSEEVTSYDMVMMSYDIWFGYDVIVFVCKVCFGLL